MVFTYKAIATVTVGSGGASSMSFSSIPQTYTDLLLKVSTRTSASTTANQDYVKFNGSSSNYSSKLIQGDGTSASSGSYSDSRATLNVGNSATASTFSNCEVYIPNYTSSAYKSYSSDSVTENNGTTAYIHLKAHLWSDSSAITSIELTNDSGSNYAQYTTATLYGIKKS